MRIISPSLDQWQEFVEKLPDFSFFHLPVWYRVHEQSYPNYQIATKMFQFSDGVAILIPLMKKTIRGGISCYLSLPNSIYGGFACNVRPSESQLRKVFEYYKSLLLLHLEVGAHGICYEEMSHLKRYGFHSFSMAVEMLTLDENYEDIWENKYNIKSRNQTRKAIKCGVTIKTGDNDDIASYYAMYRDAIKRWRQKTDTIRPLKFYQKLLEYGGSYVKLRLAEYQGNNIAGAVHFYGKNTLYYFCSAMVKEYGRLCPNNLLQNEVIRDACQSGLKYYNMLGCAGIRGIERFKESFGARYTEHRGYVYNSFLLGLANKLKKIRKTAF